MKPSIITSILLLLAFVGAAIFRANLEFMFYASTLIVLLVIVALLDRHFNFSATALWGFDLWMLLHLLGGTGTIDGIRLYDYVLIELIGAPYDILRYDQAVHLYCYIVMAMMAYEVLIQLSKQPHKGALFLISVLAATGIGSLNEVVEFAAVVLVGNTGVGGYTNTALDLVANLVGAMMGAGLMVLTSFSTNRSKQ